MTDQNPETQSSVIPFTEDMVDTLKKYFSVYASEGVVNMEANAVGLWLINPENNTRQFLGKALPPNQNPQGRQSKPAKPIDGTAWSPKKTIH